MSELFNENCNERDNVAIRLESVQKTYLLGTEGVPALRGISLSVHSGEFVIIYGTSGGGKTTALNIMGTIDIPTKGTVEIFGKKVDTRTPDSELALIRLRRLAFVFQTFNLVSSMTALENVELPMVLYGGYSASERRQRATELLQKVGLSHRASHIPSRLSGGEQQRATIARALANSPDVLLLDEPTGDLDSINTDVVMEHLLKLNEQEGKTIVMVTHDAALKSYGQRAIYLVDGKVQKIDTIDPAEHAEAVAKLLDRTERRRTGAPAETAAASSNGIIYEDRDPSYYGRLMETFSE